MARFFNLTPDISVQYWLEFLGKKAMIVHDKDWSLTAEEYFVDKRPGVNGELSETSRLYLQQPSAAFEREIVNSLLHLIGVNEDFCKLQVKRENGARMVHFRPSDENPVLLGFGRLNPRNGKKCDKNFSETFVDRKPGTVFTNYKGEDGQVWEDFKPVYLKIKPADGREEYYLKVWTEWRDSEIFVLSEKNPADVPRELRAYEFKNDSKPRLDSDEEAVINKYQSSPRKKVWPRRPFRSFGK